MEREDMKERRELIKHLKAYRDKWALGLDTSHYMRGLVTELELEQLEDEAQLS